MKTLFDFDEDGFYVVQGYWSGGQFFETQRWFVPGTED